MIDFKVFVEALSKGTPWAILIAAIGAIWQVVYTVTRDKLARSEAKLKNDLEQAKFQNQKELDRLRFDYEQRKWREQLALQLAFKHVDARLVEYPTLWGEVQAIAKHNQPTHSLTSESARAIASAVERWRYSRGGLLAEETTREAAITFQTALWEYDQTPAAYERIRKARSLLRAALRADMGLGEDALGHDIFDMTAARHKIAESLEAIKAELNVIAKKPVAT